MTSADIVLSARSGSIALDADGVSVNGAAAATVPAVVSASGATHVLELAGGTSYVFTQPVSSLDVGSVEDTPVEDRLKFTLASGGSVSFPTNCGVCPSGFVFEGGKSYVVAVMGGMIVAAEYEPGV